MAPHPRVKEAFRAMKAIGISEVQVKPVLKKLLKLYDKNWALIEAENYRVLADAIFDDDDSKVCENVEEPEVHDEVEQPLKRSRSRSDGQHSSQSDNSNPATDGMPLKKPKVEGNVSRPVPSQDRRASKGKEPMLPQVSPREKRPVLERPSQALRIKENAVNSNTVQVPRKKVPDYIQLVVPKDEPFTDDLPHYEAPLRMIMPDSSSKEKNSAKRRVLFGNQDDHQEPPASHNGGIENEDINLPVKSGVSSQVTAVAEDSTDNMEIASSSLGEVKISLSCNSLVGRPNFHMPGQDELLKSMQGKCLRSYKIFDPNFSIKQMLKDMCDCFLELATDSSHEPQERLVNVTPLVDVLKKPAASIALGGGQNGLQGNISNGFHDAFALQIPRQLQYFDEDMHPRVNGTVESDGGKELSDPGPESRSLVVVPQHQLTSEELRALYDFNDLTKGEEKVQISWINEISNECPPSFHYIPGNLIFQNAFLNFTLSQIKAEDCCSTCVGDCLSSTTVCACASEAGDVFAYASDGLLREDFLDDCITMTRDPQQQCLSYCRACPVERSKNDGILEPCKGHLNRRHIKECWSKCGCHKQCGNRVVQRGIRHKLQVFFTPDGKGWGLRTLEKLPKGTFICEFVGEILTNTELNERNVQHTHPVLLDAYWFLKGVMKDEEALCLDATFYGNVARFINHRCLDANLIEIPVKIETTENHYYHLAFFTTREVDALEELTWDYGIDFDDNDQPIEMFRCLCGSKFCRNMKRSNRPRLLSR